MAVPPGPRGPALFQTLRFLRDPAGQIDRVAARYGEIFTLRFVGGEKAAYVSEPGLIREAFATDRDCGLAGKARARLLEPLVGSHSLLTLDGPEWERQRKLLGPAFHGENVSRYADEIREIAAEEISTWRTGEEFELRPRMQTITLEVILRLIFGLRDGARQVRLRERLPELAAAAERMIWLPPWVHRMAERAHTIGPPVSWLSPVRRFFRLRDEVDEILFDEIRRRRDDPDIEERIDVMSWLIGARDEQGEGLTDRELRDELVGLLEAGHETTATALSWAFERILRTPGVHERLAAELDGRGESDDGGEAYVEALARETLRSRPVVMDVARLLDSPLEIGGYEVPAGWYIAPGITLVHHRPDSWEDAAEFRPERFLGDDVPYRSWIPFGGGRRRCVGAQLAMLELKIIITEVMRHVRLSAPDQQAEPAKLAHVTLVPAQGSMVKVEQVYERVYA